MAGKPTMAAQNKMGVDVDFKWKDVVIGADLEAVQFAHDNKYFLIKYIIFLL